MIAALVLRLALVPAPLAAAAPPAPVDPAASVSARGRIRSAGERAPLEGARIFATARSGTAWTRETTSASDGTFLLTDLPTLDFDLTIVAPDHQRLERPTTSSFWRRRKPPTIYLQPTGTGRYRTVVAQERSPRPTPFSVRLSPEEIAGLPGSQGDPLRALQNLPGSARIPGGLGLIVLRGATPNQSQVFVGEHPVPRAFHVPGLASVVPAGALSGLQYIPGNFAANYGNAVGGLVVLQPRVGRRDGLHGHARLDLTAAGALVEGPIGRGSFLIAAQRGYLDLALRALGPEVLGSAFLQPKYHDYQIVFDQPVGAGATLTTRLLGASDDLGYAFGRGEVPRVSLRSAFHRIDLVYRKRLGPWDFMISPALRLDRSGIESELQVRRRDDVVGLLRAELTARPSRRFQLTVGADTQLDRHRTLMHVSDRLPWLAEDNGTTRGFVSTSGAYLTPVLAVGRFTLSPGLRVSLFTGPGEPKFSVDPRVHARWAPHPRVAVQLGAGRYAQPTFAVFGPQIDVQSPIDSLGIPRTIVLPGAVRYLDPRLEFDPRSRLALSQALQLSASVHLDLTAALGLDGTVFYRRLRERVPTSPEPTTLSPLDGASVTYGVEAMLRHQLTRRLFGWLAYTWMNSRSGWFTTAGAPHLRYPADFDQRHNLVAVLGYKLPRRWQLGARFRVVTGLPVTPAVGGTKLDEARPYTSPLYGEINSARMPVFHQLDIRVDKTWVLQRSIVAAYLDVQNVYNRQNAEGLWYLHDFSATRTVVGVPILPVLGVRVDY